MGRITNLPAILRESGYPVYVVPGWEGRGHPTFNPRGGIAHHDAFKASISTASALGLLQRGRPDVPGPLCQIWLDDDNETTPAVTGDPCIYVVASGRANHAGKGGWNGLSGNTSVWGIEARHTGSKSEPWSPQMYDMYVRVCASLAHHVGHGSHMICGHKEWAPTRKIDPTFNMSDFRSAVKGLLGGAKSPVVATPGMNADMAGRLLMNFAALYDRNGGPNGWPTIRLGSTGDMVRMVQGTLLSLSGQPAVVDGVYGPATKAAVEGAQRMAKMGDPTVVVDGVCGFRTYQIIRFAIYVEASRRETAQQAA